MHVSSAQPGTSSSCRCVRYIFKRHLSLIGTRLKLSSRCGSSAARPPMLIDQHTMIYAAQQLAWAAAAPAVVVPPAQQAAAGPCGLAWPIVSCIPHQTLQGSLDVKQIPPQMCRPTAQRPTEPQSLLVSSCHAGECRWRQRHTHTISLTVPHRACGLSQQPSTGCGTAEGVVSPGPHPTGA